MSMSLQEAISELKTFPVNCLDFKENQALEVVIEAVEKYNKLLGMTADEIESLDNDQLETIVGVLNVFSEHKRFKSIGTVEEFDHLKKMTDRKKSEWIYCYKDDTAVCKNCSCEHYLGTYRQYATKFCPNCGCEMEE